MAVPLSRYRFTVAEYEAMGRAGILGEDARVELIRGEVIQMSPVGPRHADSVAMLNRRLTRQVPDDVLVLVQSPIRLPDNSDLIASSLSCPSRVAARVSAAAAGGLASHQITANATRGRQKMPPACLLRSRSSWTPPLAGGVGPFPAIHVESARVRGSGRHVGALDAT